MNTKLTVGQRRRIANECIPREKETLGDCYWNPKDWNDHYRYLVTKVAQMIDARLKKADPLLADPAGVTMLCEFNAAMATNSTPEIERLAWELLEKKDE